MAQHKEVRTVGVVPARCEQRPLQLFGAVNWAMREAGPAEGIFSMELRKALSVFKPFIWRLDQFIGGMERRSAILFRGLKMVRTARHYTIALRLVFPAFTSLSENAAVAWAFAGEDGGTWLSVQVHAALDIACMSQFPAERELLLRSNTAVKVADKPADDVKSVLLTTNDAVSLVQCSDVRGDHSPRRDPKVVLEQRLQGLRAQSVIFSSFRATYVTPRVRQGDGGAELPLGTAFREFCASDKQWCVLIGAPGEGKSSALLHLYDSELQPRHGWLARSSDPRRLPLFVSLPLVPDITGPDGWLRRQVSKQLSLEGAEGEGLWAALVERRILVCADSADECAAHPTRLMERSLADRSGLPPASKCIVSVRGEDMARLGLSPADLGGSDCAVFNLLPFGEAERDALCDKIVAKAADEAVAALKQVDDTEASRADALRQLPGCRPQDEHMKKLQDAVCRGDTATVQKLRSEYMQVVGSATRERLRLLRPGATRSTLLFAMAAEAAADLGPGADAGTVIDKALRRRMHRSATLVDPSAWGTVNAACAPERLSALMRVAEAVAAALVLSESWAARIGDAARKAAPLCEVSAGEAAVLALFPGLPLRTASAEDPDSPFTLPHRHVHVWLAVQWAARAPGRGLGAEAALVQLKLYRWAGELAAAGEAAQLVADAEDRAAAEAESRGAECGAARLRAVQARIIAFSSMGDKARAAEELRALAGRCEEVYGEMHPVTATALFRCGECFGTAWRDSDAVPVLERAVRILTELHGAENRDAAYAKARLGMSLVFDKRAGEGLRLLQEAHGALAREGQNSRDALRCLGFLGIAHRERGDLGAALECCSGAVAGHAEKSGRLHPDTIRALLNRLRVQQLMALEGEAPDWGLLLRVSQEVYRGYHEALPQGDPRTRRAAVECASALYRAGDGAAAEALLREQGAWDHRQEQIAKQRAAQRGLCAERGREGYTELLRGGPFAQGSRKWCLLHLPELTPEVDAQLRRIDAGEDPL
eukprot:TRINITY_DN13494_c0_g4_i2.p1 TRINITY_DN13494_c0_g4~~TRINITY_DN13494_c0_g4_i2.p1  ORF type:complete len:1102 (+),score=399.46 TRINITY_DN13494_c0_g4_i2:311-3307(+)